MQRMKRRATVAFWLAGSFFALGGPPPLAALESSAGTDRITRSDVNGGNVVHASDSNGFLQGSLGTLAMEEASAPNEKLQGGIQGNLYYPTLPKSFQAVSVTSSSIDVNWRAPAAGVQLNLNVGEYQLRQRTTSMTQDNFDTSVNVSGSFQTLAEGSLHANVTVPSLDYNTIYFLGLAALDSENPKNRSYVTVTSTCTLAPNVVNMSYTSNYPGKSIQVTFNPQNTRGDTLYFEGQLSDHSNFTGTVLSQNISSPNAGSVALSFGPLNRNKDWYFHVRVRNQSGTFTPWYPAPGKMNFDNDIPTNVWIDPGEVYVTSATLHWSITSLPAGNSYNAQASYDNFATHKESGFINGATSFTFTGLSPNRSYQFKIQVQDSFHANVGETPTTFAWTGVSRVAGVEILTVLETSALVRWADDSAVNGTDPHSYSVEISSESATTGYRTLAPKVAFPVAEFTLGGLPINTPHYVRVRGLNAQQTPSAEGPSDVVTFCTKAVAPGPLIFLTPSDERAEISFSWAHNGNNPVSRYQVDLSREEGFGTLLESVPLSPGQTAYLFKNIDPQAPGVPVLANDRHYVRVRTIQASNSLPFDAQVSTGSWITAPLTPTVVSVESAVRDIEVQWTDEWTTIKNSPNTRYSLTWSTGALPVASLPPAVYAFPPKAGTPFKDLLPNTTHQMQVTALPMAESNFPSVSVSTEAVTLVNPPSLNPSDQDIFQSSVTVRWTAPGNPSGTNYKVELSTSASFSSETTTSKSVTGLSQLFEGLTPNRGYLARVAGVNHQGVWTPPSASFRYKLKPVPPSQLVFSKPLSTTEAGLTLSWQRNGNDEATNFDINRPPSATWDTPSSETFRTFLHLAPNSLYSFRVRARAIDSVAAHDAIADISAYTRAQPAGEFDYGNITDFDTWQFKVDPGANNPQTTQYAFQLQAVGSPTPSFDQQFLKVASGNVVSPSPVTNLNDPSVWRTLAQWGLPDTVGRYVLEGDLLPSRDHRLLVYVRNVDGDVEAPSQRLIEPQSGPPQVELTVRGSTVTPSGSWTTPVYVNDVILPFRASGSSHFNFLMSSDLSDLAVLTANYTTLGIGWNGIQSDAAYCSNETTNVTPSYDGALKGVCVAGEGLYYLHVLGNKMTANTPTEPIFVANPSFRVYVDTTPPGAGTLQAESSGVIIPDNGETKGLAKIGFSWPVIDGGNAVSRSPIVGWSYSLSLNNPSFDPPFALTGNFVHAAAVSLRLEDALGGGGVLPSTGAYTFKVRGVDQAGNWQPFPTVFTYNFKEDSIPPSFKGATLAGSQMPKGGLSYAAVPVNAPIQLDFSEPMNFSPAIGGIRFIQTHNASGQLATPRVVPFNFNALVNGASTSMMVQANTLEAGSRYEIHSSTSNLFDLGGNRLPPDQKFDIVFFTQLNPTVPSVFETAKGQAHVDVSAGALGSEPSGVAFDGNVKNDPMRVGDLVRRASGLVSHRVGGSYNQVLDVVEYTHYGAKGNLVRSPFVGPVTLRFSYRDDNGDGIEDRSDPTHPIKVEKLAIYGLDEDTGVWLRMPGSRVDVGLKEVRVDLQHFSAYALMGAGDFDLTDAHVFPVPFRAKKDTCITFVFPNAQMATVKVYTLDGKLIKTLSDDKGTGFVKWDPVVNDDGDPVGSDVYLYIIENDQQRKVGKLMVIR